jgi:hypothetical protein
MITNATKENEKDSPYNFAVLYYIILSDLIKEKDLAYLNNDVKKWFKCLNRLYIRICFQIKDEEERADIKKMFLRAKEKILNNNDDVTELHDIDEKLMVLMDKYKMIFPRIPKAGFQKITDRYKLSEEEIKANGVNEE